MKSGIKTTEFWLTVLTVIISVAGSIEQILEPKWAAIVATISTIAYSLSRALVKKEQTPL